MERTAGFMVDIWTVLVAPQHSSLASQAAKPQLLPFLHAHRHPLAAKRNRKSRPHFPLTSKGPCCRQSSDLSLCASNFVSLPLSGSAAVTSYPVCTTTSPLLVATPSRAVLSLFPKYTQAPKWYMSRDSSHLRSAPPAWPRPRGMLWTLRRDCGLCDHISF